VGIKETQYIFKGEIDKYFQLSSRSVIQASYHGAAIFSNKIFQNELFRIGGFHLLRGFNEQSVLASQYHIGTIEYHYLLGQNSYFYLFFDGAYVVNESLSPVTYDTPIGFGAGINFETRAGIFGVNYALGQQQNNPIQFRNAKIHFGYVNYF
jgi:hemolysin activation/secretion protein